MKTLITLTGIKDRCGHPALKVNVWIHEAWILNETQELAGKHSSVLWIYIVSAEHKVFIYSEFLILYSNTILKWTLLLQAICSNTAKLPVGISIYCINPFWWWKKLFAAKMNVFWDNIFTHATRSHKLIENEWDDHCDWKLLPQQSLWWCEQCLRARWYSISLWLYSISTACTASTTSSCGSCVWIMSGSHIILDWRELSLVKKVKTITKPFCLPSLSGAWEAGMAST